MVVASFGPATAWHGRSITYEAGRFLLEGHGEVPAAALLDYDRRGQLEWAYDGLREWVQGLAAQQTVWARPAAQIAVGPHKPFPVWAIVVIVAVVAFFAVSILAAMAIPMYLTQHDKANEAAVKEGIHSIQIGIQSWSVDHGDDYPDFATVSPQGLAGYVDEWPQNPYTGGPMAVGMGAGDYTYSPSPVTGYRLTGYGQDGDILISLP